MKMNICEEKLACICTNNNLRKLGHEFEGRGGNWEGEDFYKVLI